MTLRQWLIAAGVVLAVAVLAFSAGRFSAPEQTYTSTVNHVVYKDRIVEQVVHDVVTVATKAETKIVYRDVVRASDGTVTDRSIETTKDDTKAETKSETKSEHVEVRDVERVVTVEKVVTLRPDWRVGVGVGYSFVVPAVPVSGPLVLQAAVDRRIVGGVSVGLWASTVGAAGVAVGLEF